MKRPQRLRANPIIRDLVAQNEFSTGQLIQPLFLVEGIDEDQAIDGLGETCRTPLSGAIARIEQDMAVGVRNFIIFPVPAEKKEKDLKFEFGARAVAELKRRFGSAIQIWVDTCLCSFTAHGHCCLFHKNGNADHEATLSELARSAKLMADSGADGISPSDMMDGRVARIRCALDEAGHGLIPIMSYSTKFASNFYGPFRGAADSAPRFGDRRQYQIDVRNRNDALQASIRCAEEGADLLMVKPGMSSIDLIADISRATGLGVGAYQVSGEYAGMLVLGERKLIDFRGALLESWLVMKRAGAQYIVTYGARHAKDLGVAVAPSARG
jgi:porphobilinogen synthase